MGYLNYNLEKVASVIEESMEKQALSLARLMGMGINAAKRGKLGHFAKRLEQRNQAMLERGTRLKDKPTRRQQFDQAIPESQLERSFLGAKNGPASSNARRLGHRVPDMNNGAQTIADNIHNASLLGTPAAKRDIAQALVRRQPVPMDIQNLSRITNSVRTARPDLMKQITAGKNLTATAQSPVPLHGGMSGSKNLTDDLFFEGGYRY